MLLDSGTRGTFKYYPHRLRVYTCVEIDAHVLARSISRSVCLSQLVQHIGGVKSSVVAQLAGDGL